MDDYTKEVFEPIEDTQVENSQDETTSQIESSDEEQVQPDTQEVTQQEPEKKDNDTVRYEYFQSLAAKERNQRLALEKELAEYKSKLEPSKEDVPPTPPADNSDPLENLRYTQEMTNYTLKRLEKIEQQRQQEVAQRQRMEEEQRIRQFSLAKLTEVTKNPHKSQNILNFFSSSEHLQNPKVYDVMYDAAMEFINGKTSPVTQKQFPPPPLEGGGSVVGKKSAEDVFNEQLREKKTYRL